MTHALVRLIDELHPRVGSMMLHTWKFPAEVARAPAHYSDFSREHGGPPDYVDLITVAVSQSAMGRPHP